MGIMKVSSSKLRVKKLTETAIAPTLANVGEDVGYDLYADEYVKIPPLTMKPVRTGIAIEFTFPPAGGELKNRSSMAKLDASVEGGVIDAGYRGEIIVMIRNNSPHGYLEIMQGSKFVQMLEVPVPVREVVVVDELTPSQRGDKGFGSSGK